MRRGFGVRLAAGTVDVFLGFLVCYILHWFIGYYFASRAVVALHIGEPASLWKGPIPLLLGIIGPFFYVLPFAFLLIFLPEAIWGWSIGKKIFELKIEASKESLWTRYLIKTSGLLGITLALIIGSWELTVISTGIGIIILLGFFLSLGREKTALHDRLAGTVVVS